MSEILFPPTSDQPAYAGIGSRETPDDILDLMSRIGLLLMWRGYILRSGGARGADQAFASRVVSSRREIYLPWPGFEDLHGEDCYVAERMDNYEQARSMAEAYHPAWRNCREGAKKLHTRNVYQILGKNLSSPVRGVVCWTKNAKIAGGTGQAMRIASSPGVQAPIYNLCDIETRVVFEKMVEDIV